MEEKDDVLVGLADKTGALLMIDKKERELVRELLTMTLKSPSAREWISKKLGKEYVQIGMKLLKAMGGE
ncbi:MAG: hypothetical protein HGA74_17705 [Deltaproteobacteria bacterium]|jgi:hypothetical protein|nr:hypothetical protein [Deltaproteobacteria bacterium]NTV59098.1 hypothetical protein [Deltaproteobacteria bacterium]